MQYNKAYRIALPAGRHKVKVEDTGHDWITVGYEIPWRVAGPPLRVYGLAGIEPSPGLGAEPALSL